ncbi:MAG: DNA polymerase III subunit gamma/tau [Mariprofundales bacterium]
MNYQVLARRWRPHRFSDLVGQEIIVKTLQNAIISGKYAQAYLLVGIRGIGKTTLARLMAMSLNCLHAPAAEPCGSCAACKGVLDGSSMDVREMDAASHTGVDDVRELLEQAHYPPVELRVKTYIIDEAHMLSRNAFNAFLKTLEEPPAHMCFILATTEADKLPITVRSRCQRFDLRTLATNEIANHLGHVFQKEHIAYEAEACELIASAAEGSMRDALTLSENVLYFMGVSGADLGADAVRLVLGLSAPQQTRILSEYIFAGDGKMALATMQESVASGFAPQRLLKALGELWHALACVLTNADILAQYSELDLRNWLQEQSNNIKWLSLDMRYQVLVAGMRDLYLLDERRGAEMLVLRLAALYALEHDDVAAPPAPAIVSPKPKATIKPPVKTTSPARPIIPVIPVIKQDAKPSPADINTNTNTDNTDIIEKQHCNIENINNWEQAIQQYASIRPSLAARLEHILCLEFKKESVRLALNGHQLKSVNSDERHEFATWLKREVLWEQRQGQKGNTISEQADIRKKAETAKAWRTAENDPHVQLLKQKLGATLEQVLPAGKKDTNQNDKDNEK